MDHSELRQLVHHMQWADAVVWASILEHPETHSDEQLRTCVHHAHQVQWAYLQIWRNEELAIEDLGSFKDLLAIHEWCKHYYVQLTEHMCTLDSASYEREIEFPWADELVKQWGHAQPVTLAESILQITSHSTYHRGQTNRRLRELGTEPPLIDFVVWIWMGRPNPDWIGKGE